MSKVFAPKSQKEIDAELSGYFGEENIYDDSIKDLADCMKADLDMKEKLRARKELEKKIIIELGKLNIKDTTMTLLKLIGGIIALVVAFVFTFIAPGSGVEQMVVQVAAALLGAFGISNWRINYGLAKDWFKSKSIVSAILVMVVVIGVTALSFFNVGLPAMAITILQGIVVALGGVGLWGIFDAAKFKSTSLKSFIAFAITAGSILILNDIFSTLAIGGVSLAVITALTGQTKAASQKTARQRTFGAKEALADSYVTLPPDCLKSVKLVIKGVNDQGAFGENTIGQEVSGELIVYAAEAAIRTYCHELVSKKIEGVQLTTNSGQTYAFATADATPALSFAYDEAMIASEKDEPTTIKLKITGYRDNLVMS